MFHIYAQYFHPHTLLERVRDVRFYRQPRTMFKGFKVPDWATAKEQHGWDGDTYSRVAWDNAMHDMHSEWTPTQFMGERQEPNIMQWFRWEQWGHSFSSRLFYNEVPRLQGFKSWYRLGGHYVQNSNDEREVNRKLHSFTHANQDSKINWGIDTTTPEGREQFKKEWDALSEMAPELIKKEDIIFPHEQEPHLSTEPHFRRVWQHYREHTFRLKFAQIVEDGAVSQANADTFAKFIGSVDMPTFNIYILAKTGKLDYMKGDAAFETAMKVFTALGFDNIELTNKTAEPYEEQFWNGFDGLYNLTEAELKQDLQLIITDPNNRAKVQALMASYAALE